MLFQNTSIPGVTIIELERHEDERGFFARAWCRKELEQQGLRAQIEQCSVSFNARAGTLRGMHYQRAPHTETKIVTCLRGAIYDVVLDLRRPSPTYKKWVAVELSAESLRMIYIPEGCAHGFQTLAAGSLVQYQISDEYSPDHSTGVRWNDPAFGIVWPPAGRTLSSRDATYPDFLP